MKIFNAMKQDAKKGKRDSSTTTRILIRRESQGEGDCSRPAGGAALIF